LPRQILRAKRNFDGNFVVFCQRLLKFPTQLNKNHPKASKSTNLFAFIL